MTRAAGRRNPGATRHRSPRSKNLTPPASLPRDNEQPQPSILRALVEYHWTAVTTDHDWRSGRDRIVSTDAIAEPAQIQRALRGAWFHCGVVRRIGRRASQRRGFNER